MRFKKLALLSPIVGLILSGSPASAQMVTAGTVQGQVTLTPALNVTPSTTSFGFQSTSITGAFVQADASCPVATGTVGVSASGNSLLTAAGGETVAFGAGTVNTLSGNGTGTCLPGGTATITVAGTPIPVVGTPGIYVRVGGYVWVWIWIQVCVNGHCHNVWVKVEALFTPNGVLPPYSSASFTGAFAGAGV